MMWEMRRQLLLIVVIIQCTCTLSEQVVDGKKNSSVINLNSRMVERFEESVAHDQLPAIGNKNSGIEFYEKFKNSSHNQDDKATSEASSVFQRDVNKNLLYLSEPLDKIGGGVVLRDLSQVEHDEHLSEDFKNKNSNPGPLHKRDVNKNLLYLSAPLDKIGGGVVLRELSPVEHREDPSRNSHPGPLHKREVNKNLLYLSAPLDKIGGGVVLRELSPVEHHEDQSKNFKHKNPNPGNIKSIKTLTGLPLFKREVDKNILDLSAPLDKIGGGVVLREANEAEHKDSRIDLKRIMFNQGNNKRVNDLKEFPMFKYKANRNLLYLSHPLDKIGGGVVLREINEFEPHLDKRHFDEIDKSGFNSMSKRNFDEIDRSGFNIIGKRDFDEIDKSGFNSMSKRNFDEIDKSGFNSMSKRNFDEIDKSGFNSMSKRNFDEIDRSGFNVIRKRDFDEIDKSGFNSMSKRNFDEIDKTGFNVIGKRDFDEIDKTGFNSIGKRDFDEIDKSGFNHMKKRNFDEIDKSGFNHMKKRNFDEIDKSGFNPMMKRNFDQIDKSGFNHMKKRNFDEIDKSGFNHMSKRDFDEIDKSGFNLIRKRDLDKIIRKRKDKEIENNDNNKFLSSLLISSHHIGNGDMDSLIYGQRDKLVDLNRTKPNYMDRMNSFRFIPIISMLKSKNNVESSFNRNNFEKKDVSENERVTESEHNSKPIEIQRKLNYDDKSKKESKFPTPEDAFFQEHNLIFMKNEDLKSKLKNMK